MPVSEITDNGEKEEDITVPPVPDSESEQSDSSNSPEVKDD